MGNGAEEAVQQTRDSELGRGDAEDCVAASPRPPGKLHAKLPLLRFGGFSEVHGSSNCLSGRRRQ